MESIEELLAPLSRGRQPLVRDLSEPPAQEPIESIAYFLGSAQGTVWFLGNGGSAATAAHVALDALAIGLKARALPDVATLSAYANDYGYEQALWTYVSAFHRPDDRIVLISVSGESPNVLFVAGECEQRKIPTLSLVGQSGVGALSRCTDQCVSVDSGNFALVEYVHLGLLVAALEKVRAISPKP